MKFDSRFTNHDELCNFKDLRSSAATVAVTAAPGMNENPKGRKDSELSSCGKQRRKLRVGQTLVPEILVLLLLPRLHVALSIRLSSLRRILLLKRFPWCWSVRLTSRRGGVWTRIRAGRVGIPVPNHAWNSGSALSTRRTWISGVGSPVVVEDGY